MYHGGNSGHMKKLITLLTIFSILACFCLALVPVQAEQEPLWSYTTDGRVYTVAITPDGNYIAAGSVLVRFGDARESKLKTAIEAIVGEIK